MTRFSHATAAGALLLLRRRRAAASHRPAVVAALHEAGFSTAAIEELVPPDWPGPRAVQDDGSAWPGRLHPSEVPEAVREVLAGVPAAVAGDGAT